MPKAFQLYCPGKTGKIPGRDLETLKVLGTKSLGNLGVQMSQDFPAPSFQFLHGFCFLCFELLCKKTVIFISTTVLWLPVGCLIIQVSLKNFSFRREQGEMHLKSNERKLNCPSYLTKLRYTLTFAKRGLHKSIRIFFFFSAQILERS